MGVVYRGRHLKLPREVAIKMVNARDNNDLRRLTPRFEREAFIQSQLDHPGIVKVYDYIVTEGTYYIVMEYVVGQSLAQLLRSRTAPMPIARTLRLFEQIVNAVAYAHNFVYRDQDGASHRGIIHRDLKPANILVTPDERTKITDFGIVKFANTDTTGTFGVPYGTPHYVSPEQAEGDLVDQRSDIYSLGTILYEMLTGSPPFGRADDSGARMQVLRAHIKEPPRPPSEFNPEINPEVEGIVLRALEKKPERRFATATEFLRAVRHALGSITGDNEAPSGALTSSLSRLGTRNLDESATGRLHVRRSYVTQPLRAAQCAACGAEASPDQKRCE